MKSKKKTGRPAGAKQNDYEYAIEVPAVCPICGSDRLTVLDGYPPRIIEGSGTTADGLAYCRVEFREKQCICGKRIRVRRIIPLLESEEKLPTVVNSDFVPTENSVNSI